MKSSGALFASSLLSLLVASGCKGAESTNPGDTTTTTTMTGASCATLAAQCLANQQGCVETSTGAVCQACAAGTYAASTGTCEAIVGTPLSHEFPDVTAEAGEEVLWQCRSWTLDNDTELWVNAVELTQTEDSHHSNWTYVPEDEYTGPDGIWPCGDRSYDFYAGVAAGGLVYAQSTQAPHEVQRFPAGTVIRIPPRSRIISDIHVLNTTPEKVTGHAKLTLYTLPEADVKVKLTSFHVEYDALNILPQATTRFIGQCAVGPDVAKATGAPFAPKVYYLLPHTHTLATGFFAEILGGPNDGQRLLDLGSYNGDAHGVSFDPPIDMAGSDGFRFACQYTNPGTASVGWGVGSQEMCELFGFADTTSFFQSRVNTGTDAGKDGDVQLFTGTCDTQVFAPSN
ncbi:MAG: hypothetical protein QM820_51985 [Minicystis sp.]